MMTMKHPYTITVLIITLFLAACSGNQITREDMVISASHSIYIEGGVLKVLSADRREVLYIYVRPEVAGRWVVAGGEGGNQSSPWLHKMTMYWALGDEEGWFAGNAPRKAFSCLFDSRNRTLTTERGTYAVSEGGLVVISLGEDWQPGAIKTGINSLRSFDIPDENRKHLLSEVQKHID